MDRDGIRSTSSDGLTKNANGETISAMTFAVRVVVVRRGRPRVVVSRVANAVVAVVKVPLLIALLALAACGPEVADGIDGGGGSNDGPAVTADLGVDDGTDLSAQDLAGAADLRPVADCGDMKCAAPTHNCGTQFQGPTNLCVGCGTPGRDACFGPYCSTDWTLVEIIGGWVCRKMNGSTTIEMAPTEGPHCNSGVLMVTGARRFYCDNAVSNAGGSAQPCVQTIVQCDVAGCSSVTVDGCRGDVNAGALACSNGTCG
jgi:hypothetical protein